MGKPYLRASHAAGHNGGGREVEERGGRRRGGLGSEAHPSPASGVSVPWSPVELKALFSVSKAGVAVVKR